MHELGIATGVLDTVKKVAIQNNATKVKTIDLNVGTSSAVIEEAIVAAFDALKELDEYSLFNTAKIKINMQESTSICLDCGHEYTHGIGASQCPKCESFSTQIIKGTDIYIDKIEIES